MITSEHSANSSFPPGRSKPFWPGNHEQGGSGVMTAKNRLFRHKVLQICHLRSLSVFLRGFFRHNRLPARYLHRTTALGPCMVLVWSLYGPCMVLVWLSYVVSGRDGSWD